MVDVTELDAETGFEAFEAQGWQKRSILDEPRLSEAVQMYQELGFEVKVVKLGLGGTKACSVCLDGPSDGSSVVYTRSKAKGEDDLSPSGADELFG